MRFPSSIMVLVVVVGVEAAIVACRPAWIGDSNKFLREFINHEYLNVLGVILAITLASLAQAHLSLNRIEEDRGREFMHGTRAEIRSAAYWLIGLFIAGFLVVAVKPMVESTDTAKAIANAIAIFILAFYVLILIDITSAVFDIKADIRGDDAKGGPKEGS